MRNLDGSFDELSPELALDAVAEAFGLPLDGTFVRYPSYANRVFGLKTDSGAEFIVKFYRPGRWGSSAIREEHAFLKTLAAAEVPVVEALPGRDGDTLQELFLEDESRPLVFRFALFPKRGGRGFDAESDDDFRRLGSLAGRIHEAGAGLRAASRQVLGPGLLSAYRDELLAADVVHPECADEFGSLCTAVAPALDGLLGATPRTLIHGDFHRGNVLDRQAEGLLAIDFDDCVSGPPIQDLWLLLPGRVDECRREFALVLEGYEDFRELDPSSLGLVEPLRFLRMVHFLAWQSRQRGDRGFQGHFPDWGTRPFWTKEVEDLRTQALVVLGGGGRG